LPTAGREKIRRSILRALAAKEAVSKALSTGWSGEFEWKNVEVTNEFVGETKRHSARDHCKCAEEEQGASFASHFRISSGCIRNHRGRVTHLHWDKGVWV